MNTDPERNQNQASTAAPMTRQTRRRLERRADKLLSHLHGPANASPRDLVYLAPDAPRGLVVHEADRLAFLARLGLHDLEAMIPPEQRARATAGAFMVPVLVVVEGWACLAFRPARPLAPGGDA